MARRRKGRPIDGLLVLDKPSGLSSNAALQHTKRLYNAAKAGHTGNLDPLATGVLPLCFGEATKFSQFLLDADKGYFSTFILGVGTSTADADGETISVSTAAHVTLEAVTHALPALTGVIQQIPPMYSALKVDGQPLYKRARAGQQLERAPRTFIATNRIARPIVALALYPGPRAFRLAFNPKASRFGPLMARHKAAPPVLVTAVLHPNAGSHIAAIPARTTGKC